MAIHIYNFGPSETSPCRLLFDTDTNLYTLQWYNTSAATYEDVLQMNANTKEIKILPTSNIDVKIDKDIPKITLTGEEAGGIETQLKEDAGSTILRDETNTVDLLKLAADTPIEFDIAFPAIFESAKSVNAATKGNTYDTPPIIPAISNYATDVAIEASWTGDANTATKIGVWDDTDKAYICSVEAQTGTNEKSPYATLTAGHTIFVRTEITTAASGATTDVTKAIVYVKVKIS